MDVWNDLEEAELIYKQIYKSNPNAYEYPMESWELFLKDFNIKMPKEPPTHIASYLPEQHDYFLGVDGEVALVKNARYCPPFWHRLAFIKVVYVLRGSGIFFINNEKFILKEGRFCIVGPHVRQSIHSCNDDDLIINLLMRYSTFAESFSGLLMEQGIMAEFLWKMLYNQSENMALLYTGKQDQSLQEIVEELCKEILFQKKQSNVIRKSLLLIFFGEVLRFHSNDLVVLGKKSSGTYHLPKILNYMRTHIKDVTLPDIAIHFSMSEGYLSRYIKKETGHTFSYLLCEYRMQKAEEMLKNTDISIDRIIETVGYIDKSQFYRNFNRIYGMSPIKYRKIYSFSPRY